MTVFKRFSSFAATVLLLCSVAAQPAFAAHPGADQFRRSIQPILSQYCSDCHGDGMKKGNMALDEFKSDDELVAKHDLWWNVLRNLRAGLMPPEKKAKPSPDEKAAIEQWIKKSVFHTDPQNPDPGKLTIRRLNRIEYRNTIRDLLGIDFNTEEEFPADDTGYGFDNIGDVLTLPPLLLEKYMNAAEIIVSRAVPRVGRVIATNTIAGGEFRTADGGRNERWSFYKEAHLAKKLKASGPGTYRLVLNMDVVGSFDFDPGRCKLTVKLDGNELFAEEQGWESGRKLRREFTQTWNSPGEHELTLDLTPLVPVEEKKNNLDLRINSLEVVGPLEPKQWIAPPNYSRFFPRPEPPQGKAERKKYAREVLQRFSRLAFRRPVDSKTLDRLMTLTEPMPGRRFEDGVAQAMVAILCSPRFLFRLEEVQSTPGEKYALVDEYSLASRLSYFLWSSMPDEELLDLAAKGHLRSQMDAQVKRMLTDTKSDALVSNFTGQWLQARDIEGISVNLRRESAGHPKLARARIWKRAIRTTSSPGDAPRNGDALCAYHARGQECPRIYRGGLHLPERPAGRALWN
jgi:hypothetical protein